MKIQKMHPRSWSAWTWVVAVLFIAAGLFGALSAVPGPARAAAATNTWSQQYPATSPPARAFSSMAYDPVHRQVVLFGGLNDSSVPG